VLAGGLAWASAEPAQPAGSAAQTHIVTIENMRFDPEVLRVKRGDRVIWRNQDLFPHTATARNSAGGRVFDSGSVDAGKSWTYVTGQPGDYAYVCDLHPTMKGRLVVQ
jgi:plastocyanin